MTEKMVETIVSGVVAIVILTFGAYMLRLIHDCIENED